MNLVPSPDSYRGGIKREVRCKSGAIPVAVRSEKSKVKGQKSKTAVDDFTFHLSPFTC